jgi:hypothetical protein
MSAIFHKLCENLSSSMDRNELYQIAKQLGLPVNSTMKKDEFCAAVSTYAINRVGDLRQIFQNNKALSGGYFDAELNEQIDEDIGDNEGDNYDFDDDLYDYDGNMEDDRDIEDDVNYDESETGFVQSGGSLTNRDTRPIRSRLPQIGGGGRLPQIGGAYRLPQIGGGNFEIEVPIGYVHRSYIARLLKELPNIRDGAKARLEFRENIEKSDKNFATGSVWIVTQNQSLLEELRRKTAGFITELENENLRKNPGVKPNVRRPISMAGYDDTVKLPGPIHKRFIGELIKSFADLKKDGFETARLQYISTSEEGSNIGMGYVQVWVPTSGFSQDDAHGLGDRVEQQISKIFQKAETEKLEAAQKKALTAKTRIQSQSQTQTQSQSQTDDKKSSPRNKVKSEWEDYDDDDDGIVSNNNSKQVSQKTSPKSPKNKANSIKSAWDDED